MTTAELRALEEIVGREYVQGAGLAREYHLEGVAPEAVVEPGSVEEVAVLLKLAGEQGWAVVTWGGATQIGLGPPPERYHLALTTRRLNHVLDYQPDDMTVALQSGVILDNLARVLAERGQFLPLDPPLPQRATAGGTVAAAATGPLRAGYGTPRDFLIGATVSGADGSVIHTGGRVVKNVAGYDLCKLYTGSYGTLGVLAELTFRVVPRPPVWAYSAVAARDAASAEALLARVLASDVAPVAMELVNHRVWQRVAEADLAPDRLLLFGVLAGEEEAVAWQQAALEGLAAECRLRAYSLDPLHAEVWFRALRDYPARPGLTLRLSLASSETTAVCQEAEEMAAGWETPVAVIAHAASGVVWVRLPEAPLDRLPRRVGAMRELALERGGTAVVHQVPAGTPRGLDRWGPAPGGLRLMEGIKSALDPKRIMSPGRYVGGI